MKRKKVIILLFMLVLFAGFLYSENNFIEVTNINLQSQKIPKEFKGFRIVQISDLHSKVFGKNQKYLVEKVKDTRPDIIVLTGDMVDSKYNEEPALTLIDEIKTVAPLYYVTGNHEFWSGRFPSMEKKLLERGVRILRNKSEIIKKGESSITILGIDDPMGQRNYNVKSGTTAAIQSSLKENRMGDFKILLSHRPELIDIYAKERVDLVFTGHAHGGQFRLPFIGGVIAPNQGFNPEYTSGKYEMGDTAMVVSRGLGNSRIPQRLFNRPEIVVVDFVE